MWHVIGARGAVCCLQCSALTDIFLVHIWQVAPRDSAHNVRVAHCVNALKEVTGCTTRTFKQICSKLFFFGVTTSLSCKRNLQRHTQHGSKLRTHLQQIVSTPIFMCDAAASIVFDAVADPFPLVCDENANLEQPSEHMVSCARGHFVNC